MTSVIVAAGITVHSEFGYLVPTPEQMDIGVRGEVRAICHGWPVRHRFQLTSEHGTNFIRVDRDSSRNIVGIPNTLPWQLVDTHNIDESLWNTTIWLVLVFSTFVFVMHPLAEPWDCRRLSIFQTILVAVYVAIVLRLSSRELLTWTHLPIAFGVMCFLIEVIRTPLRGLNWFQRVVRISYQRLQEYPMNNVDSKD